MNTINFNQQYIRELEDANYFGGNNGETPAEIEMVKSAWLHHMSTTFNIELGETVDEEEFEAVARLSLMAVAV